MNRSGRCRRWTPDEVQQLDRLVRAGQPVHVIARKLGRPDWALYNRRDLVKRRRGVVFERGALARLFGVDDASVAVWQRHGWLPMTRNGVNAVKTGRRGPHSRAPYLITDTAIEAFLANRATWYAWDPDAITDPTWQALALTLRTQADGRWLTTEEAAAVVGASVHTMRFWHQRGTTSDIATARYGIQLYWWSADLAGWVPPTDRLRVGAATLVILELAQTGTTSAAVAARLGRSLDSAAAFLAHLTRRGLLRREVDPAKPNRYRYWTTEATRE
jgi:hypothetical protein